MPDGPSTALGIGSGLARGLAAAFGQKRERDFITQRDKAARDSQIGASVLGHLIESGRIGNYEELVPYVDLALGTTGAKPKKGELSHHDILSQVLSPTFSEAGAATVSSGGTPPGRSTPAAAPAAGVDQNPIVALTQPRSQAEPATTIDQPGAAAVSPNAAAGAPTSAPARRPGLKILTDAEMLEKQLSSEETLARGRDAQLSRRVREFYDTFKGTEPEFNLYDAIALAGGKTDYNRMTGTGDRIKRNLDAFVEERRLEYERAGIPWSSDAHLQARADWFKQSQSIGTTVESKLRELYGVGGGQASPEQIREAQRQVDAQMGRQSYLRGRGAGQASLETDQGRLLTPSESTALQSTYGITRAQASSLARVPLTPPQVAAATESYLLDKDIADAQRLFTKVWPKDSQPEARRVALLTLQRSQDPEFIQLLGILKRMPLRLAVMTQGSRPSDTDREVFDAAFPSTAADDWSLVTVPTSFEAGEELLRAAANMATTSRESIGIIPLSQRGAPPPSGGGRPQADAGRRARARAALQAANKQTDDATITRFLELNPNFR